MNNERYKEYLQSDQWKYIKAKVISRDKGICQGCFIKAPLEVHHLTYKRIGEELGVDLISLCSVCHNIIHEKTNIESDWSKYINKKSHTKPINTSELSPEELHEYRRNILMMGI